MAATLRIMMKPQNGDGKAPAQAEKASATANGDRQSGADNGQKGHFGPKQIDAYFRKLGPFLGC